VPDVLVKKNRLVEVSTAGKTKVAPCLASEMDVRLTESYGQLRVTDSVGARPLSKVYVKVFARLADRSASFHEDVYTDVRGRFDSASVNTPERQPVSRVAVPVLGAATREATPRSRKHRTRAARIIPSPAGPITGYRVRGSSPPLRLPKHPIDDPAPADVRPLTAAVAEHVGVAPPGVRQRVGKDREAVTRRSAGSATRPLLVRHPNLVGVLDLDLGFLPVQGRRPADPHRLPLKKCVRGSSTFAFFRFSTTPPG
jgi:hypothetical protein